MPSSWPRIYYYYYYLVVPAGLALFSSLLVLLLYIPFTSDLPLFLVVDPVYHLQSHPSGYSELPPPPLPPRVHQSPANITSGGDSDVPGSAGVGKAPPFSVGGGDGADTGRSSEPRRPVGYRGNNVHNEVFHDKDFFLEDYKEMKTSFKIYVYPHSKDDPFAHALLPVDFEPGGNYASESYFKKVLMQSHFITADPSEADLFFLPFSIARLRHDRRVDVGGIPDFVRMYIVNVSQKYPYWNRTDGADHFYVACHSTGRSAMEKAEAVKFNVIQVVCSSSYFLSGYVAHKDSSLPQIWPRKGTSPRIVSSKRSKLAFFAGSINSPVREELLRAWRNDSAISVHFGRLSTPYTEGLLGSKFCLHVKGFEVNTARIADAIYYGCVPVIIANHYDLPFADVLNWTSFSVVVATLDIPLLKEILYGISSDEYVVLRSNMLKVRRHFRWHLSPLDYDAFYMVMYELWLRRSTVRFPLYSFPDSIQHNGNFATCL